MKKPQFHLKLYKFGKTVYQTTRASKRRLLSICKAKFSSESIDKVYLEVRYTRGSANAGFYSNFKDFKQAYESFSQKSLLDDFREVR